MGDGGGGSVKKCKSGVNKTANSVHCKMAEHIYYHSFKYDRGLSQAREKFLSERKNFSQYLSIYLTLSHFGLAHRTQTLN